MDFNFNTFSLEGDDKSFGIWILQLSFFGEKKGFCRSLFSIYYMGGKFREIHILFIKLKSNL